jgi:hypothetical protein
VFVVIDDVWCERMPVRLGSGALVMAATVVFETLAFADATAAGEAASGQPARDPAPSMQVNASLSGSRYSLQSTSPTPSTYGTTQDLSFSLTRYLAPLRDDGAPYSLQPFLQRSNRLSIGLGGGHLSTHNPFGRQDHTVWNGGVSGSLDVYVKRWLALNGGLGYGHSTLHDVGFDQSTHSFSAFLGIGLRLADTRIDAWYDLVALDQGGSFAPLRRQFGASAFTAIARRFTLNVSGSVIANGVAGDLSLEYFATRELGIYAGTLASRGKLYSDESAPTRYAGWAGLAAWLDPAVGIGGAYQLTIEDLAQGAGGPQFVGYHQISHALSFALFARFEDL